MQDSEQAKRVCFEYIKIRAVLSKDAFAEEPNAQPYSARSIIPTIKNEL